MGKHRVGNVARCDGTTQREDTRLLKVGVGGINMLGITMAHDAGNIRILYHGL